MARPLALHFVFLMLFFPLLGESLIYSRLVLTLSKDDLDFCILLPLLPKHWDDKCIHTVIYEVLGIEPQGASCMLGKHNQNTCPTHFTTLNHSLVLPPATLWGLSIFT